MSVAGYATLPIIPSFQGVAAQLEKQLAGPMVAAAEKSGKAMENQLVKSAERAAQAVEKARYREKKATEEVEAAESKLREQKLKQQAADKALEASAAKLADARTNGAKDVAKFEEQYLKAQARSEKASQDVQVANRKVLESREELATATRRLKERTEELDKAQDDSVGSSERMAKSGENAGAKMEKAFIAVGAAVGVVAAAGTALYNIGSQFDDAYDSIRVGTGASGEALAGLEQSLRNVAENSIGVGSDLGEIGGTLADLNTRLGLTGEPLEKLTSQFQQLKGMGIDADINAVTGAFQQFGVQGDEAPAMMDKLFQISQATGKSITDITGNLEKSGPALQQFGFGLETSAGLLGALDKAGLDSEKTLGSMTKALGVFAAEGKNPQEALWGTINEIDRLTKAGKDVEAIDLANSIFGAKGGAGFVAAVESGQFAYDDFMASIGASGDTIGGVAQETADFAEHWDQFKNRAMIAIEPVASAVFSALVPALEAAWQYMQKTWDALVGLAEWAVASQAWLLPLAAAIGGAALAWGAWNGAITVWQNLTKVATGIQAAFNAVMAANPIMLAAMAIAALVAGLVVFFTKTETGRQLWETFTGALKAGWESFSTLMGEVWETRIKPVFEAIGAVASWLWNEALLPTFQWIGDKWNELSNVFSAAWHGVVKPVFDGLGAAAQWLWDQVLNLVFGYIRQGWENLVTVMNFLWGSVLKPMLEGVANVFRWLWDHAVNPVIGFIQDRWRIMGDTMHATWSWINDNIINRFMVALDVLKGHFNTVVDGIGVAWDRMKDLTRRPVEFVVNTVYNNGIRKAWNAVGRLVGMEQLPEHKFATGGILPGYTPGRDIYEFIEPRTGMRIGLSGGEPILRPEAGRVLGSDWVDGINAAARMNGEAGVARFLGQFASGGIVSSITAAVRKNFPGMTITSTFRNTNDHHGAGKAVDFSDGYDSTPGMRRAAQWFFENYGAGLLELIHSPFSNNVKNGRNVGDGFGFYGAGTMQAHRNHVHVAAPAPLGDPRLMVEQIPEDGGGFFNPMGAVKKAWDAVMNALPGFADADKLGVIGQLPAKFLSVVAEKAWGFITDTVKKMGSFFGSAGTAGNAESWREMAMAAMRRNGFNADDPRQVNAMLAQIMSESGGNPNIAQQIVDINGTGESAGVGLLQIIPGTFAAHRDPTLPNDRRDPWANMNAALRYYRARYGTDLTTMWGKGHGYATGGILPKFSDMLGLSSVGVYDTGGILPRGGMAVNFSGFDEVITNGPKLIAIDKLANNVGVLVKTLQKQMSAAGTTAMARGLGERFARIGGLLGMDSSVQVVGAIMEAEKELADARDQYAARMAGITEKEAALSAAQKALRDAMGATADNADAEKAKAESVKKATEQVAKAEKDLAAARLESIQNLDMPISDVFPQLTTGLSALAAQAGAAGPQFAGLAGALGQAAMLTGPAGVSVGVALSALETGLKLMKKAFDFIEGVIDKIAKSISAGWQLMGDAFSNLAEWQGLVAQQQQQVSALRQQVARDTIALAKAQLDLRVAFHDRVQAEVAGITSVTKAAEALWSYETRARNTTRLAIQSLTGDVDRLRWATQAALQDAAGAVEQTREWRALAFDYFKASAEAERNQLAAQEGMLNALRTMATTTLGLQRSQYDLVQATARLNQMTAETFGYSRSEATVGKELAEVSKQITELEANLHKPSNWLVRLAGGLGRLFRSQGPLAQAHRAQEEQIAELKRYREELLKLPDAPKLDSAQLSQWQRNASIAAFLGVDTGSMLSLSPMGNAELAIRFNQLQGSLDQIATDRLTTERLVEDLQIEQEFERRLQDLRAQQIGMDQLVAAFEKRAEAEREDNAAIREALLSEADVSEAIAGAMGVTPVSVKNLHQIQMPDYAPREVKITHVLPDGKTSFTLDEVRELLRQQDEYSNSSTTLVGPSATEVTSGRRARI